jgi:hypothetical protein
VDDLEREYRATAYVVFARGPPVVLRVGARNRALDRLLHRNGCREWAFITAWNPRTRLLPRWRNERRQRALARLLPRALLGAGIAETSWAEESLLALGVAAGRARRLARQFGQNAIVAGRRGGTAQLIWCVRPRGGDGLTA